MLYFLKGCEVSRLEWSLFVQNNSKGNVFQIPEYYEVNTLNSHILPFTFGVKDDDRLVGLVSGQIMYNGGKIFRRFSSRAIILGGPLIIGDERQQREILTFLLNSLKHELKGKVIYIQFRNLWDISEHKELFLDCGFLYEDHLDILVNLQKTEEEIWNNFSRDRKKSIIKGLNNLYVEEIEGKPEYFAEIYNLLNVVYRRIKLPLPNASYFKNVNIHLSEKGLIKVFGAFKDSKLVGVRLVFCYKEMIYDWFAGADDDYLELRPNDALIWTILKWGHLNKFKVFDFGGAGKPNIPYGVRDYKLKFGGDLVNFGRYEFIVNKKLMWLGKIGKFIYSKI